MAFQKICGSLLICCITTACFSQDSVSYERDIRPLLAKKCFECHNTGNPKGDVNLDNYKEQARVIKDGQLWLKVLEQIRTREMPPKSEPRLSEADYNHLLDGINSILQISLQQKTPGKVVIRRLGHSEYQYTVQDLLGVSFDARNYFPSDGSGGGGFDNQGRSLFFTPLKLERYYDAATEIIDTVYKKKGAVGKGRPTHLLSEWVAAFQKLGEVAFPG